MKLSMVAPLYKSAPYIPELYRRLVAASAAAGFQSYEVIFVVDGSPDASLAEARKVASQDPHVTVIDLARNFGQHRATMTGLAHSSGDYVFMIDSDLEEHPEWLIEFYQELTKRDCDVVFGVSEQVGRGPLYSLGRWFFYKCVNFLSAAQFPENTCSARMMTRRYVNALLQFKEREIFMLGICHIAGFAQLPCAVEKRGTSPSSYSFSRRAAYFIEGITAFSTRPLVIITLSGMVLSSIAFLYLAAILFLKLFRGVDVEGWASVMGMMLLIGGITIFFNGVIAIYVAKIFSEVKQRPYTIIRDIYSGQGRPTE